MHAENLAKEFNDTFILPRGYVNVREDIVTVHLFLVIGQFPKMAFETPSENPMYIPFRWRGRLVEIRSTMDA